MPDTGVDRAEFTFVEVKSTEGQPVTWPVLSGLWRGKCLIKTVTTKWVVEVYLESQRDTKHEYLAL